MPPRPLVPKVYLHLILALQSPARSWVQVTLTFGYLGSLQISGISDTFWRFSLEVEVFCSMIKGAYLVMG